MGQLPSDMVYTITSGFYPELFSKDASWKRGVGKGRKGMQWVKARGYSKGSIKTVQGKPKLTDAWVGKFFGKLGKGQPWDEAYQSLDPKQQATVNKRGQELQMKSQGEMEQRLTQAKFLGNNEAYKLWGSKVWYQHGQREDKPSIMEDLSEWLKTKKNLPVYLENLYSSKEGALVKMAQDLAKDVFGAALDESNLRKDLESVGAEADVPEEERKEVPAAEKVDAIPSSFKAISQAREADIKYRMKDGTALYMDSTEMPLHAANQHGITESGAKQMKEAIDKLTDGSEEELEELRGSVEKLFISNISSWNTEIKSLMKKALPKKDQGKGIKSFKQILKNIHKANVDRNFKGDNRASVGQIGALMGVKQGQDLSRDTGLKFIVHTLVNLAGSANDNFRQGHLVGNFNNQNVYASVDMKLKNTGKGVPQFMKPQNILMLRGESHLLAIQERDRQLGAAVATETKARQIQAFAGAKTVGIGANGQINASSKANFDVRTKVRQSTTVTFAPKTFEDMINKIPEFVKSNTKEDAISKKGKSFMQSKRKHKLAGYGNTKFWAMPYIGLMEYPSKATK